MTLAGSDQFTGTTDGLMNSPMDAPGGLALSSDGRRVAFAGGRRSVLLYDLSTGQRVADLGPPAPTADAPRLPVRARPFRRESG